MTYDIGFGLHPTTYDIVELVKEKNLSIDFELVTATYDDVKYKDLLLFIRDSLLNHNIVFFGHGHEHLKHDELSYNDAYNSFKTCYDLMDEWGLKPVTYAYPHGSGKRECTQLALLHSGFLSGRGATAKSNWENYYICPYEVTIPKKWHFLPSIVIGIGSDENVNSSAELQKYLDINLERKAWVTILYHSIGLEGSWAYYPLEEFKSDLDYFSHNDFWVCNLDNATSYILERNNSKFDIKTGVTENEFLLNFSDGLDNEKYCQPISFILEFTSDVTSIEFDSDIEWENISDSNNLKILIYTIPDEKDYKIKIIN